MASIGKPFEILTNLASLGYKKSVTKHYQIIVISFHRNIGNQNHSSDLNLRQNFKVAFTDKENDKINLLVRSKTLEKLQTNAF
jgi:hypothetical protein